MRSCVWLCLVAAIAACDDDESAEGGGGAGGGGDAAAGGAFDLEVEAVSVPARVSPAGGVLRVEVTVRNSGDAAWTAESVRFAFAGDAGWAEAALVLPGAVAPGASATLTAELAAPAQPGRHHLRWQAEGAGAAFGASIEAWTEVTCSDGVFCNGAERFSGGACVPGAPPCDDGADCTADRCDEESMTCSHELAQDDCASCASDCTPECDGKVCGDDGCGGSCGACGGGEACSATGECRPADQPGTCASPLPLLGDGVALLGRHVVQGDSTTGLHQTVPTCNSTSTAVEQVYVFTLDAPTGIDARTHGYDTVLSVRRDCADDAAAATAGCSDDASPPGDYGSRVAVLLQPGTWYLIVDGFDSVQYGPYTLEVSFVAGCVPQCDGRFCGGDDGCGGDCGTCDDGFACVDGRCQQDPCVPQCDGRTCGDDGCGGTCGACPAGQLCVPASGTCAAFPECDHEKPTCSPACGDGMFCGSDCQCHELGAPMPDLVVNKERLSSEILFDEVTVDDASCAVVEECVGGLGRRRVLRFSVEAINQGQATLTVPPPAERPDLFTWSPCHGHYHFLGFATYALLDDSGGVVLTGRKQAYCMEDTAQYHQGPHVGCAKEFDCENQGIQAGWSDLYGNALDCQWLDITDTPPGDYHLLVDLNPNRAFEEITLDNNSAVVPVTIPAE